MLSFLIVFTFEPFDLTFHISICMLEEGEEEEEKTKGLQMLTSNLVDCLRYESYD